eukprot:1070620-Prymnesium_polylepis.1
MLGWAAGECVGDFSTLHFAEHMVDVGWLSNLPSRLLGRRHASATHGVHRAGRRHVSSVRSVPHGAGRR